MIPTLIAAALAVGWAAPAAAHATLERAEAASGETLKLVVRLPHGCDGAPTIRVEVDLPEGVIGAKPMPKAGWTLATETGPYARRYELHGAPLSEGVRRVVWSGGELADAHYDEFVVRATVAAEPGAELPVRVRQLCPGGAMVDWSQVAAPGQDPHDLPRPAPVLRVAERVAQAGHGGHGGHGAPAPVAADEGGAAAVGPVRIEGAWVRAAAARGGASAAYMTLTTSGPADRLIGATSPAARRVELHTHILDADGVARMRAIPAVDVAPGAPAALRPGGLHVMLMGIDQPLTPGGAVELTLTFEKAGSVTLSAPVLDPRSAGPEAGGAHDGHGGGHGAGHGAHGHGG